LAPKGKRAGAAATAPMVDLVVLVTGDWGRTGGQINEKRARSCVRWCSPRHSTRPAKDGKGKASYSPAHGAHPVGVRGSRLS